MVRISVDVWDECGCFGRVWIFGLVWMICAVVMHENEIKMGGKMFYFQLPSVTHSMTSRPSLVSVFNIDTKPLVHLQCIYTILRTSLCTGNVRVRVRVRVRVSG